MSKVANLFSEGHLVFQRLQPLMTGVDAPNFHRILVTGSSGFIGTNLCQISRAFGHEVAGVDIQPPKDDESINEFHQKDICDIDWQELDLSRFDAIIHLAAKVSVPESMEDPEGYFRVNVTGTERLFKAGVDAGVKKIIFASSAACYGDSVAPVKSIGEEGPLCSPYAENKRDGEHLAERYGREGTNFISFRFFNVFGTGQSPHSAYASVIPLFIHRAIGGEELVIHGDGSQTRDFVHVNDLSNTILQSISVPTPPSMVMNIGTGRGVSIAYLAECVINSVRNNGIETPSIVRLGPTREGDILHSTADTTGIENFLNPDEFMTLEDGLDLLVPTMVS